MNRRFFFSALALLPSAVKALSYRPTRTDWWKPTQPIPDPWATMRDAWEDVDTTRTQPNTVLVSQETYEFFQKTYGTFPCL